VVSGAEASAHASLAQVAGGNTSMPRSTLNPLAGYRRDERFSGCQFVEQDLGRQPCSVGRSGPPDMRACKLAWPFRDAAADGSPAPRARFGRSFLENGLRALSPDGGRPPWRHRLNVVTVSA
jgi:hypothetical protein